jgi:hypothetical protein
MPGAFLLYAFLRRKNLVQLSRREKDIAMKTGAVWIVTDSANDVTAFDITWGSPRRPQKRRFQEKMLKLCRFRCALFDAYIEPEWTQNGQACS